MKILGILGSPHNHGNTVLLLDALLHAAAQAGAETEKIGVAGLDLKFCIACGECYRTGTCIYTDDVVNIHAKMMEADGIVLASPNYFRSTTAQLKTIFDRFSVAVHCFFLDGKYGASVTTAGSGDDTSVADLSNGYLQICGAQTVGTVGATGAGIGAIVDQEAALARAVELGTDLVAAIQEKRVYPDQMAAHAAFSEHMKDLVLMMGERAPFQVVHWKKMGWL